MGEEQGRNFERTRFYTSLLIVPSYLFFFFVFLCFAVSGVHGLRYLLGLLVFFVGMIRIDPEW